MKLENKLLQNLTQQQKLSQRQQYDLKVLEMNTQDLSTYIEEEVESNPLLEQDECYETAAPRTSENLFDLMLNYAIQEETLCEVLQQQIDTYPKDIHKELAEFIINSLDSNGYLHMSDEELQEYFPACSLDDIEDTISTIQTFEPAGICARTLQESLLIQLCFEDIPYSQIAIMIVNYYLRDVADNKLPHIAEELCISLTEVNEAVKLIRSLNPKPGAQYAAASMYSNPDAEILNDEGELTIHLFHANYGLRIKHDYDDYQKENISSFIKEKEKSAAMLLDSIEKRNSTFVRILQEIVKCQKEFFLQHAQLRPLNMKDIAEQLSVHESTVSRAIANKSILFERQSIPLKFFFPVKLGEETSANELQLRLKELIKEENKKKPMSDQALSDQLNKEGYPISRRTIAKYREQLKIPPASKRKQYE